MKNTIRFIVSVALIFGLFFNALPCGPGYITPVFEYKHAPENPFENFAGGKIGILKPSYRRIVLFAAYRYLNGGGFTTDEQKGLTDVWNAEFNNRDYKDNDVAEAVKAWIEKRKDVLPKEEKPPEIYTEREYGGYDFFPNCTKNAFETAAQTLSDRSTSYGADSKDVKDWLTAQDQVFTNCSSGKQTPDAPNQTMPEWLQKDRAYQLAAADFYSLDYENAKRQFAEIAQDSQSSWQETADYLVARTLIRQASLTDNEAKANPLYTEAEMRLNSLVAKGGKFGDSSERLLGLVKYRLHPQERVGELGRNLSVQSGNQNFRQDLIDYNWLLDRFAKETLEKEEKRKEKLKPQDTNANSSTNKMSNSSDDTNSNKSSPNNEGLLSIYFYNDDYSKNWTISVKSDATDDEAIAEAEKAVGAPLTDKMKEVVRNARQTAYSSRFSSSSISAYQGGYYGTEEMSLSILPEFLRRDDLTDWLFAFQIENTESYLYALSKFRQSGAELWLMTALAKADKNSAELKRLLEATNKTSRFSPAYPTIAFHTARILVAQDKQPEARKLLDEILASSDDLPVSSRNQFLEQRIKLAKTLDDFLRHAQRKPFAFDFDGQSGTIEDFIREQKSWYDPKYEEKSREDYEREVEERFQVEKLWQDRFMFDYATVEQMNQHFPTTVLLEAQRSPALPDYLRGRFALAIWTRAVLLNDLATTTRITPEVVQFKPELTELMNRFLSTKTPLAKQNAAFYLILKNPMLTPYLEEGLERGDNEVNNFDVNDWWCAPYEEEFDETAGNSVPKKLPNKPAFLTAAQSATAQAERKKLKTVGDAPKFLGETILAWAKRAPTNMRIPESLFIVWQANGWTKYGCGNNDELRQQIGNLLKKRYPRSDWTQKVIDEEKSSQ